MRLEVAFSEQACRAHIWKQLGWSLSVFGTHSDNFRSPALSMKLGSGLTAPFRASKAQHRVREASRERFALIQAKAHCMEHFLRTSPPKTT